MNLMASVGNDLKALLEKGFYTEIIQKWTKGDYNGIHDPNNLMIIAADYYKIGDIIKTKKVIEDNYALISNGSGFHAFYGSVLRKSGLVEEAKHVYEEGLITDPNNPFLKNNYANLLIDIGDLNGAESILKGLLKSKPANLEDIEVNLARIEHARSVLTKAQNKRELGDATNVPNVTLDPLKSAFTSEEVEYSLERRSIADRKRLKKNIEDGAKSEFERFGVSKEAALLEFTQLCRQTYKNNPEETLNDLDFIFKSGLKTPILYDIAADCYLRLTSIKRLK